MIENMIMDHDNKEEGENLRKVLKETKNLSKLRGKVEHVSEKDG